MAGLSVLIEVDDEDDELTPPLEIGLDDDEADLGTSMTSMSDDPELRDLQAQFSMQEDLLGQLKGVLRSNEAKLHFKEREVEVRFEKACKITSNYLIIH